jgi:DNA invertase Pin-like site-specific DNA recombinase
VAEETLTTRAVGYARCSTAEQASEGMGLETQVSRIRAWADAVDAEVVEVVTDGGVSGGKPLAERAGGKRIAALLDARKPDADAVVVLRLDRLGRDAAETLALLKRFRSGKVGLVSVADRLDLGTPHGRAMAGVTAVFAELERALVGQRTADALGQLRNQGRPWNHPPFGWQVENGHLKPHRGEQATLARARELRAEGHGYARIAAILNEERRPSKRGGLWRAMSVRSVLLTSARLQGRPGGLGG